MNPRNLLVALLLQTLLVMPSIARTPAALNLPQDLAKAASEFDQAQINGDANALRRLLADSYVLINSRGEVESKSQFIADYTTPGSTLMPYRVEKPIAKIWRNGAVLSGVVTLRGTSTGKPFVVRIRFADVWCKCNQHWQVLFTQAMKVRLTSK